MYWRSHCFVRTAKSAVAKLRVRLMNHKAFTHTSLEEGVVSVMARSMLPTDVPLACARWS